MALLLFIDTSTRNCSVLLAEDGLVLAEKAALDTHSHVAVLQNLIAQCCKEANKSLNDLNAVAISEGPGSYTGLRIGMSAAKGFCFALNIPLISLDTLECLALETLKKIQDYEGIYIATLNSRKGEIYFCVMDGKKNIIETSQPAVIEELTWNKYKNNKIYIAGNTKNYLENITFVFSIEFIFTEYLASNYVSKGFEKYNLKDFDNLIDKEPNYLKPFH